MNYVYMLECNDGSLYTGWTNRLEYRMEQHANGLGAKYTRSRLPVRLVYQEECVTPTDARKREAQIKKLTRSKKLQLVKKQAQLLALASEKLQAWGLPFQNLGLLREKQGIALFRLQRGADPLILKLFIGEHGRDELYFYDLLAREQVSTIGYRHKDDQAILLDDLQHSDVYQLGLEADMQDPAVMRSLGEWYRRLHQIDITAYPEIPVSPEWMLFRHERLAMLDAKLCDQAAWGGLFPKLKQLIDMLQDWPLRLCFNDFYYVNLVRSRDKQQALMIDYDRMSLNYPGLDLVNALWFSEPEARAAFRQGYGLNWAQEDCWTEVLLPLQASLDILEPSEGLLTPEYLQKLQAILAKNR